MKFTDWIPAITGILTVIANLVVTSLNIKSTRHLEREKKRWELHAKNLERLVDLKEKLHTYETPPHFDLHEVEWALKDGAPSDHVFDSISQYLAAQATGYNFAVAEYRAHSHLFEPTVREVLSDLLANANALEREIGPSANRTDEPLSQSGLEVVDMIISARHRFIDQLYEVVDTSIDSHRKLLQ